MAIDSCVNGSLDDASYSSPVPVIGLYVAAANSVCFLFMFFDILSGFRNRKRWLPCGWFSLNSVTLTLLSIATKIPVDLTTTMPSPQDQLSKLTGTTLICTCMGFLVPSLGVNSSSECLTNMAALSILVVTVVVNICIQMHTGVIVLFKIEHIMIMCCMMLLLLAVWCFTYDIDIQKQVSLDQTKNLFTKGKRSMLDRLKECYLHAYGTNPQLELCIDADNVLVVFICLFSSVVVVQAAFRSIIIKQLKLCDQVSDYKWSIWLIIVTQIATILIGSFGTSFRSLALAHLIKLDSFGMAAVEKSATNMLFQNPHVHKRFFRDGLPMILISLISIVLMFITALVYIAYWIVECCCRCCCCVFKSKDGEKSTLDGLAENKGMENKKLDDWARMKGEKDMKNWMQVNEVDDTLRLLSKTPPSEESLTKQLKDKIKTNGQAYEVSSLSVVLLVRIVMVSVPNLGSEWAKILDKFLDVIHFVDQKMNSTLKSQIDKSMLAKATWRGENFDGLLRKIAGEPQDKSELSKATWIIENLEKVVQDESVWSEELTIITKVISPKNRSSMKDLIDFVEQLFVDMLNEFFIQLPNAIYRDIVEGGPEDLEERIGFGLKAICQVKSLKDIKWSYPRGTNISDLISDTDSTKNDDERSKGVENIDDAAIPTSIEHSTQDEISQV